VIKVVSPSLAALWLCVATLLGGCSASHSNARTASLHTQASEDRSERERRPGPAQPPETPMPHPSRAVQQGDEGAAVREAAASELGPEAAASMPPVASAPLDPVDPGAALIIGAIDSGLAQRATNDRGVTVVSMNGVRNLSRTDAAEFERFIDRFAGLLTRAGAEAHLEFTRDAAVEAHYRMQGTAYLTTAAGFDQWEMFLSIAPAERDFTVWDARSAVRVLRNARPNQPQVLYIGR
jgi:hypothetical protein